MPRLPLQVQEGLKPALALAIVAALAASPALGRGVPADALRQVADAYVARADLAAARADLARQQGSLDDLVATLRVPRPPREAPVPGERVLELVDGAGTRTELAIVAPTAEALAARGDAPLGLVVLLHGLGGSYRHMLPLARALAATGQVVCACPTAQKLPEADQGEDGVPVDGLLKHWWEYDDPRCFVLESVRRASALYRIDPDRVSIAGHSMGGYGSYNLALRHPDRFAAVAPLAGGINRLPYSLEHDVRTRSLLENGRGLDFFVVHGSADQVVRFGPDQELAKRLRALGARVDWRPLEGVGHGVDGVARGAGAVGKALVEHLAAARRGAPPERVVYASWGEKLDGAHWLRILERSPAGRRPEVTQLEGRIDRARNAVVVSGKGVARARVYLDERLLDLARPVRVEVGDAVRFEGKATPSLESVLESWRSREDPGLVYPAFVDVDPRAFE